ncbi:MAG: TIGR03364 family FAD-dependent oxidoreductase [Proteobacteria bacterium]|nr:TIGR03364 family FAD-dependent oxidoreductase [Pseudomonadota bacterium]
MNTEVSADCVIVGAGVIGLAHALVALRRGLRAVVVDRDPRAMGASVRNFGFVTVTGQQEGVTWRRAMRSRDVWAEVAKAADIPVLHRGLLVCAIRPEAVTVLEEFAASAMGAGCTMRAGASLPPPFRRDLLAALESPHEIRVESREAIPRLAHWLETQGVRFMRDTAVHAVESGRVHTSRGTLSAPMIAVCPGTDLNTLFPDVIARRGAALCKLHMMRVAAPAGRLPSAVMSDLGLVRYLGYEVAPSLPALRARLERERAAALAAGIHLIAVQSADGSLVVGDSHHYGADAQDPFQPREVDDLILSELSEVLDMPRPEVLERWLGWYPSGPQTAFIEAPMPGVRLALVTSGTGASTCFAIAEECLASLAGEAPPPHAEGVPT